MFHPDLFFAFFLFLIYHPLTFSEETADLLNTCLSSKNHKSTPGPEADLFHKCKPWKDNSCCTLETSEYIQKGDAYDFTYDHCNEKMGSSMPNISQECREHFTQDMCFFECEPYVGPWKVKVNRKHWNERFYGVPLCASDCEMWFKACRNDYTCVANWTREMKFKGGRNHCPVESKCVTFDQMYKSSAKNFCEQVWDGSFVFTPDTEPCMRLWFDGSKGNPNERVAILKVRDLMNTSPGGACNTKLSFSIVLFTISLVLLKKTADHVI